MLTPLAAIVLLRTAPVQTYLAHRAAFYLSKELNTEVVIGGFRLNWFFEAVITDIKVLDKHNMVILEAKKIRADVKSIDLRNRKLHLNEISLTNSDINIIYYKADSSINFQFIVDHFASPVVDTTYKAPWALECDNVKLINSHFSYRDERYMNPGKGIDFSDMDISNFNTEIKDILVSGDSLQADIRQLTFKEKSGFSLVDFTTKAIVCPRGLKADNLHITTGKSRLSMDLKFEYNNWSTYDNFLDSIKITAAFAPSQLDMRDIVSFVPTLDGMEEVFDFSGKLRGPIASFIFKDFQLAYGNHTSFKGNINMNGLPDIENTFINIKSDEFYASTADIQSFTLPYSKGINTIILPAEVVKLGNIVVNGRFTGFYNDFVSKATFITDVGQVTTDILLTNNKATKNHEYNGEILVENFNAGKVFNLKQVGTLSLYATINGKNFSADRADLAMKGEITNLQYEGNTIGLINVDGKFKHRRFTGGVYINDELINLDFIGSADFSDTLPAFDFQADVVNANLVKLNLVSSDSIVTLSTSADFRFRGNTLDNMLGSLRFSNTAFRQGARTLKMKDFSLQTTTVGTNGKRMEVSSDFFNAVFSGQYTFDDMSEYLTMVFTDFLPSLSSGKQLPPRVNKGSFDYTIQLHHTDSLTNMFAPWIKLNGNTVLSGTFDPTLGLVNVNGKSPLIVVSGFALHNWVLKGSSVNKSLDVQMECSEINKSESLKSDSSVKSMEQFKLLAAAVDDSVKFGISWNDLAIKDHNKGTISGAVSFKQNPRLAVRFDNAEIMLNDTVWNSIPNNLVIIDSSYIEIQNIGFTNKNRHIRLDGIISPDPLSQLILDVKGFNLSHTDVLTKPMGIDFDGYLDGNVKISELFTKPRISADLDITKFGFNHESLGEATIKTYWDNQNSLLGVDLRVVYVGNAGTHYPIKVLGNIYPEREHENFDLKVDVDNLKLRTLEPFLEGTFSRIRGYVSGGITLTGDFADPVLTGKVAMMRSELLVNYLRTSYSFTGDFNFDKDRMWFKDLMITDSTLSNGFVTGSIYHKAFSNLSFDITIKADKLSALNTPFNPQEVYYGKAKATGTITLKGPDDNLVIKADVRSEKGTSVFIPISFSRSISENSFIKYKKQLDTIKETIVIPPEEPSNLSVQLGVDVARNADIGIILPYQMGTINMRGDGLINLGVDSRGEYSMYGQYVMDNGTFLFNFENILKKNFQIRKGGILTFNGSPDEADIKLQAVYKVKTTLAGFPGVPADKQSARIAVNCVINLSNSLYNPDIKFSIELPDANDETKRAVFSNIDTTNTLEMNQQMISLLVLNTFSSTAGISSSGAASLGLSTYDIINAQLSSLFSQISKDFDIGVKYQPGDQLSPQEVEVALSTQLFDNRVTIDGAVGMNTYNNDAAANQIIGDVLVEVKITEDGRFRVKAFNRTNSALGYYAAYSPYTQGVGIAYRKEFNSLNELFTRRKKLTPPVNKDATTK